MEVIKKNKKNKKINKYDNTRSALVLIPKDKWDLDQFNRLLLKLVLLL